jgi:purine-binding chemotaxis protein CheW
MISPPPPTATPTPDATVAAPVGGLRVMVVVSGGATAAIDASRVREVAPRPTAIRLPGAPSIVPGVVNVRGTLVPLVDLGLLLGRGPASAAGWLVTLDLGDRRCALALDLLPVLRVTEAPAGAVPASHACLAAEVRVTGASLPLLDVDALADDLLLH